MTSRLSRSSVFALARRPVVAGALLTVLTGLLAGCGGEDLAKANFQRTTATVAPGGASGNVPEGPIDDSKVGYDALSAVDPCGLLGKDAVAPLGTLTEQEPYRSSWTECRVHITDAGGKDISLGLTLDETFIDADKATGGIEGLPLVQDDYGDGSCKAVAVTDPDAGYGIGVNASLGEGSQPCPQATTALQVVLQQLHADPARFDQPKGTLLTTRPCTVVPKPALDKAFGGGSEEQPAGIHQCRYAVDGSDPSVTVEFRSAYAPDDGKPIDLPGGVKAFEKQGVASTAECDVAWRHLKTGEDGADEVVRVSYSTYDEKATKQQACTRARDVAKAVVPKLPKH